MASDNGNLKSVTRILIVDDELGIRKLLAEYLSKQGFEVFAADGGEAARKILSEQTVDLAVLDLKMPGEDGLSLARHIREHYDIGIVMLTAVDGLTDRIVGLEVGADDYITKPFDPRELLARLKSLLRRLQKNKSAESSAVSSNAITSTPNQVQIGDCVFDTEQRQLLNSDAEEIALTSMELDLLQVFLAHPNEILNREQLFELAYQRDWDPLDRSIDVRITRLRRKLEPNPSKPTVIKTVHRKGYMLVIDG